MDRSRREFLGAAGAFTLSQAALLTAQARGEADKILKVKQAEAGTSK